MLKNLKKCVQKKQKRGGGEAGWSFYHGDIEKHFASYSQLQEKK